MAVQIPTVTSPRVAGCHCSLALWEKWEEAGKLREGERGLPAERLQARTVINEGHPQNSGGQAEFRTLSTYTTGADTIFLTSPHSSLNVVLHFIQPVTDATREPLPLTSRLTGSHCTGTLSGFGEWKRPLWFGPLLVAFVREGLCCLWRQRGLSATHGCTGRAQECEELSKVFLQKQSPKSQAYTPPPHISCFGPHHKKYKRYFLRCVDFYVRFSEKTQGLTLEVTSQRIGHSALALKGMSLPPIP